ncbi:Vacuolar protein sorting-associated protein 51 [Boothiomyces sp. JEL0866]|nr:Vacuolar protein sorting-associated protein 51 [Boothiomyces sp. JEL0866]
MSEVKANRRALLQQYYQQQEESPTRSVKRADPIDIDGPTFHAELSFNMAIKEQTLSELIANNNNLVSDIKDIDGKLKTLVYQNYSKFLTASDTIRQIKITADDMDTQIHKLQGKMDQISKSLGALSENLTPEQEKIRELDGVDILVKKLNFIIDLPLRLTKLLESKNYVESVMFYAKTVDLLDHYKHIPMFNQIAEECVVLIRKVGTKVQQRVFTNPASIPKLCEDVGLMVGLETLPALDLSKNFLYKAGDLLAKIINENQKLIKLDDKIESATANVPTDLLETFSKFNAQYMEGFENVVECYDAYFITPRPKSNKLCGLEALKANMHSKNMSASDRQEAKVRLDEFVAEKEDIYFKFLDGLFQLPDDLKNISPTRFISVLTQIRKDLNNMKSSRFEARMSELTIIVLDRIINGVFGKVNQEFFVKLNSTIIEHTGLIINIIRQMTNWIKETLIAKAIPAFESFLNPETTSSFGIKDILLRIYDALISFWDNLAIEMMGNNRKDTNPFYLVLSRLSSEWAKGVIESIFSMYSQRLFNQTNGIVIESLSEQELNVIAAQYSQSYQKLAQNLLGKYCHIKVSDFTVRIKSYMNKPCVTDQVIRVSPIFVQIVQELEQISTDVKANLKNEQIDLKKKSLKPTFTIAHSRQGTAQSDLARSKTGVVKKSPTAQFDNLLTTLDTLFDERLIFLPKQLDLKLTAILSTITKCILKALLEFTRFAKLGQSDFHQLQLDMAYMKLNYWDFLDEKILEKLIDQILTSAAIVSDEEYSPLDSLAIDKILS